MLSELSARHFETNVARSILRSCNNCIAFMQRNYYTYYNDIITSYYKVHLKNFITAEIT